MHDFVLFAQPWYVNLLIMIPFIAYFAWRKKGLLITKKQLTLAALFGIAFGFVEAAVVIYIRAAIGLLPGYEGGLSEIRSLSLDIYQQTQILNEFPMSLLTIEIFRELATLIMLVTVALLIVKTWRERWAMFLWIFAAWNIFYYVGLWATVRWPSSLTTPDVLFLIPVPWFSQVWFPLLVSALSMVAITLSTRTRKQRWFGHH